MSRILFVERGDLRVDKLGFMYLSAVLKRAGHNVDLVLDRGDDVDARMAQYRPHFVMYSVVSGRHGFYLEKNRELKREFRFTSVMGGPHFTFYPEDGLDDPDVDFVVRGPAENVVVPLVEGYHAKPNKLVWGRFPDLDALPMPDRAILYDRYPHFANSPVKRFIAGRDCPHACIYCFNHFYHRIFQDQKDRFLQIASPKRMVDEMRAVRDKWGLEMAYLSDDDMARDIFWLAEFCYRFKRGLGLKFCGFARVDSLSPDLVRLMAECGCSFLILALESANPDTRQLLRRGEYTNEDVRKAIRWCQQAGIKVRLNNMIGLPVDDPFGDAVETLKFNLETRPDDSSAQMFQPFRRTDAWELCAKKGLIDDAAETGSYFGETVLDIPDREKLNRLEHWWTYIVKWGLTLDDALKFLELPVTAGQGRIMLEQRWRERAKMLYGMDV